MYLLTYCHWKSKQSTSQAKYVIFQKKLLLKILSSFFKAGASVLKKIIQHLNHSAMLSAKDALFQDLCYCIGTFSMETGCASCITQTLWFSESE